MPLRELTEAVYAAEAIDDILPAQERQAVVELTVEQSAFAEIGFTLGSLASPDSDDQSEAAANNQAQCANDICSLVISQASVGPIPHHDRYRERARHYTGGDSHRLPVPMP